VVPERCERFRESVSLGLDGMLSRFERALLERHLRSCASCRAFAAEVRAQTARLRAAPLEVPPAFADIVPPRVRTLRHRAAGLAGAVAVAAMAALMALTPAGDQHHAVVANTSPNSELLAVVPEAPTANASFQVGRLRLVSAASADGAVRGYYGVPA
jgi:predicted anti-sigma-YlaC factor YlaD